MKKLLFLAGLILFLSTIGIGIGAVYISPREVVSVILGKGEEMNAFIIMNYRLPRILVALLAGAGLAVSGAILQNIIRNPLASPDVIGITKGAGLAAVIVIILFPKSPVGLLPLAAFTGALVVAILLYLFAYKKGVRPATLALVGIALGAVCQAGIQYVSVKYPSDVNATLTWLTGSLWGRSWDEVKGLLPWIMVLIPLSVILATKMDLLSLGDDVAMGLGENVQRLRILLLIIAVALAGASVAVVGTIGFVGLIAPHMARQLVGAKHQYLLPAAAMIGVLLLLIADGFGRALIPPVEVPAGIFTAILGAPYFLYLLKKKQTHQ
ncbi:MAG: FecCD family ABC transporter permease [Tepidibacillus sp.]